MVDRKGYLATRANKRMRLFRADANASDEDLADEVAKQDAQAWAAKDASTSDDDGSELDEGSK